jgi:hypothetical protein
LTWGEGNIWIVTQSRHGRGDKDFLDKLRRQEGVVTRGLYQDKKGFPLKEDLSYNSGYEIPWQL